MRLLIAAAVVLGLAIPALAQPFVQVVRGDFFASGGGSLFPIAGWEPDPNAPFDMQGEFVNQIDLVPSVFAASAETSGGLVGVPSPARGGSTTIATASVSFGGSVGLFDDANFEAVIQIDAFIRGRLTVQEPTLLASASFFGRSSGFITIDLFDPAIVVPDVFAPETYDSLTFKTSTGTLIDVSAGPVAIAPGRYTLSHSLNLSLNYPADFPGASPFTFGRSGAITLLRFTDITKCLGDANFDGVTNFSDITAILSNWLANYGTLTGQGDANRDGVVDFADITTVLNSWLNVCAI